jgi:hypothetical protein
MVAGNRARDISRWAAWLVVRERICPSTGSMPIMPSIEVCKASRARSYDGNVQRRLTLVFITRPMLLIGFFNQSPILTERSAESVSAPCTASAVKNGEWTILSLAEQSSILRFSIGLDHRFSSDTPHGSSPELPK